MKQSSNLFFWLQCSHKYRASKSKTELYRDFSVKIASKTDVQLSHATPGAVWSHQKNCNMYADIANEMIYYNGLDIIMGCGDPMDGTEYKYGRT